MSTPDPQPPKPPALGEGGFEPYLRAVRRHPLIVAAVAIAAVAGAGAWLLLKTHQHQAEAQVLITPVPFDDATYTGLPVVRDTPSDPPRSTQTAAQMLDSPAAAAAAARALGPGWSVGAVRAAVSVTPIGGTNVLAIQASAADASVAERLANTFAAATLQQRRQALKAQASALLAQVKSERKPPEAQLAALVPVTQGFDPSFSLLRTATAPGSPAGPPAWRTLSLVLFAGLILGVAAALLADALIPRFREKAEVTPLPVRPLPEQKETPGR